MKTLSVVAMLLFLTCGPADGVVPEENAPCSCDTRGDLVLDEKRPGFARLVCTRIANQFVDGGIEFNACTGIDCCRWRKP